MKIKKIEIAVAIGLILTILFTMWASALDAHAEQVKDKVLRLHIIANSDTDQDQQLKLAVRDRLLKEGGETLASARTKEEAEGITADNLEQLKACALDEIRARGFDYGVQISVANVYFPTRDYGDYVLPAGYYDAVRVVIGEGKGKNWWCIMFPPLCVPAAEKQNTPGMEDVLDGPEITLIKKDKTYKIRFFLIDLVEKLKKLGRNADGSK